MSKQYRLGVIGAGNMGMAIAQGMVRAGTPASEIILYNRSDEKRKQNAKLGFAVSDDYTKLYMQSEMVLFAVKPQTFPEMLEKLSGLDAKPLVISIAAGVPFAKMEKALSSDCPIVRCMPNTPLLLGKGATQLVKNKAATNEQLKTVCNIFDTMGVTVVFDDENKLNDVIPFAGSAPAYIYAFTEGMLKSAEKHGINRDDALKLFCQTLIGSAEMMLTGDKTPDELIKAVCSPNGTTLEAMKVLNEYDLYGILAKANDNCIKRAYELGK
ncbi:MAG TPA: pyrroline-5-carboxylate reductase [Candidatus Butyricicoccus avistercoris]|uniref:Pyrroline-5-carboxylate reductase n=1 Tax=Candidatus Butyricicoccus avistercoris TaxID=2838518 RepID=A0A9D1THH8_9FIRM|nr:pyrroline-5-carboxylate reductase [Candidatus Butyricicoccus avistercoris]